LLEWFSEPDWTNRVTPCPAPKLWFGADEAGWVPFSCLREAAGLAGDGLGGELDLARSSGERSAPQRLVSADGLNRSGGNL